MVDEILFIMRLLKTMLNVERAKQKSREILNKIIFPSLTSSIQNHNHFINLYSSVRAAINDNSSSVRDLSLPFYNSRDYFLHCCPFCMGFRCMDNFLRLYNNRAIEPFLCNALRITVFLYHRRILKMYWRMPLKNSLNVNSKCENN